MTIAHFDRIPHNWQRLVLGLRLDEITLSEVIERILDWRRNGSSGHAIFLANVHVCMESYDDPGFRQTINSADLIIPDGKPLVWAAKILGAHHVSHIRGTDLMRTLFQTAHIYKIPIGFFGGTQEALNKLCSQIRQEFPNISIQCAIAPPFRSLTPKEDLMFTQRIRESGAELLFVFLGCPKQELWITLHRDHLSCTMLGIGAALDFYIGNKREAPRFMQRAGLEWVIRLLSEPRRLWRRYAWHNPRFIYLFFRQWVTSRRFIASDKKDPNLSSE